MHKLKVMIKYNFKRTVSKKSFIVLTIVGPVVIIAMAVLPGLLTSRSINSVTNAKVAVYGGGADSRRYCRRKPGFSYNIPN